MDTGLLNLKFEFWLGVAELSSRGPQIGCFVFCNFFIGLGAQEKSGKILEIPCLPNKKQILELGV